MAAIESFSCSLQGNGQDWTVLRLVVLHEVARLPQAVLVVRADAIKVGAGPYTLRLQGADSGSAVPVLGETAWYVNQATLLPSVTSNSKEEWLVSLGVLKAQAVPMRALVAEGRSALEITQEVCEQREWLDVNWVGDPFSQRLGTVLSLGETVEGFLRRFAGSINCWFNFAGKLGMRWTTQGLASMEKGRLPYAVREVVSSKIAAPGQTRIFWMNSLAKLRYPSTVAQQLRAHEVLQASEVEAPEGLTESPRPTEWSLHYGLSDVAEHFAICAGQPVGALGRHALSVVHVWSAEEMRTGDTGVMRNLFDGVIAGLLPEHVEHFLGQATNCASVILSIDEAAELSYLDGTALLDREDGNLREMARTLASRLRLGMTDWQPPASVHMSGMIPATVVSANAIQDENNKIQETVGDYAALPAAKETHLRSTRLKLRFDWHEQVIEVPFATPWAGAGGYVFFPPRAGDRVLVAFVNGDLSAPVVVAAVQSEQEVLPDAFKSPGEQWHACQPQGISSTNGLVLETTESGDLVLYAKKGNLVLRARDTVVLEGRILSQQFAKSSNSVRLYERDLDHEKS